MTEIMARVADSPKVKRLSTVALTGAALAVVWSLADALFDPSPVFVSSVTSLVMLLAGFYDFKAEDSGVVTFTGEDGSE